MMTRGPVRDGMDWVGVARLVAELPSTIRVGPLHRCTRRDGPCHKQSTPPPSTVCNRVYQVRCSASGQRRQASQVNITAPDTALRHPRRARGTTRVCEYISARRRQQPDGSWPRAAGCTIESDLVASCSPIRSPCLGATPVTVSRRSSPNRMQFVCAVGVAAPRQDATHISKNILSNPRKIGVDITCT